MGQCFACKSQSVCSQFVGVSISRDTHWLEEREAAGKGCSTILSVIAHFPGSSCTCSCARYLCQYVCGLRDRAVASDVTQHADDPEAGSWIWWPTLFQRLLRKTCHYFLEWLLDELFVHLSDDCLVRHCSDSQRICNTCWQYVLYSHQSGVSLRAFRRRWKTITPNNTEWVL
jgi:hypothetical protein